MLILYTESESVGKILNTSMSLVKLYDIPTDKTLKVVSNIPQILDVDTWHHSITLVFLPMVEII